MSRGPDDAFLRDVSGRLGLAMVNLYTKFQLSNYTHNEYMKCGAKCKKWGGLEQLYSRSSAMSPFDHRYDFLFDFNRNCASFLYRSWDKASYLSEVIDFNPPHLCIWWSCRGWGQISRRPWASQNWSSWPIVWCYQHNPTFSHFSITPTCDGRSDIEP